MFRHSASLAIQNRRSFAVIPSVSLVSAVSEYCSACVSHAGPSTKQATELYSDNLPSRTRNLSEPYSGKEIPCKRALRRLLSQLGSQSTENQHFHSLEPHTKPYSDTCRLVPLGRMNPTTFRCHTNHSVNLPSSGTFKTDSFTNIVERSILKLPLSKLCAVPFALQNRALFEGGK